MIVIDIDEGMFVVKLNEEEKVVLKTYTDARDIADRTALGAWVEEALRNARLNG